MSSHVLISCLQIIWNSCGVSCVCWVAPAHSLLLFMPFGTQAPLANSPFPELVCVSGLGERVGSCQVPLALRMTKRITKQARGAGLGDPPLFLQ